MTATDDLCARWLAQAPIATHRLTAEQRGVLQAAFAFRQRCGDDYYSSRLLSHFLLHCDSGLKVAHIARLVGISRPTASHQQGVSSKEAIQAAHHRLAGRPHGKLLPRYAGPIVEFILTHPEATRYDILDFIHAPGTSTCPRWPCTTSARSLVWIAPRGQRPRPPSHPRSLRSWRRWPAPARPRANLCRCRRPLFRHQDPIRGRVPLDASSLGLVGHGPGLLRR